MVKKYKSFILLLAYSVFEWIDKFCFKSGQKLKKEKEKESV